MKKDNLTAQHSQELIGQGGAGSASIGASGDSITFSLRGTHGDNIQRLHDLAKRLDVVVASVFRHDLLMLQEVLRTEEQSLSSSEKETLRECARILALSSLVRLEGPPNPSKITGYLIAADKPKLVDFIGRCSFLRLVLIIDRARNLASTQN